MIIISGAIGAILFSNNPSARSGLGTILGAVYFSYLWSASSPWPGQTVGMKILNLKVVKTDGSLLDITQSFIRAVGLFISIIVIFIGVIWVAFDANKQGWHDKIAGTYVIKTK